MGQRVDPPRDTLMSSRPPEQNKGKSVGSSRRGTGMKPNDPSIGFDFAVLGARLRDVRKGMGLSQAQMAERLGMSLRYYSSLECGENHMSFMRFVQFISVTHASPAALLTGCTESFRSFNETPDTWSKNRKRLEEVLDTASEETILAITEICQVLNSHYRDHE